jgi:hypothetical protein
VAILSVCESAVIGDREPMGAGKLIMSFNETKVAEVQPPTICRRVQAAIAFDAIGRDLS